MNTLIVYYAITQAQLVCLYTSFLHYTHTPILVHNMYTHLYTHLYIHMHSYTYTHIRTGPRQHCVGLTQGLDQGCQGKCH